MKIMTLNSICKRVIIFLFCLHVAIQEKIDNDLTKLSDNEGITRKSTTIFDYHTRMSAYKDLIGSGCYIEFIKTGEPPLSQKLREFPTKKLPKEIYISDEKLSKRKIWDLAGPRIYEFCKGFPTYLIQEVENKDSNEIDNNIIKTEGRKKRSTRHYFVGRLRGQTQSQYLNFGGNHGNGTGRAEAESNYGNSRAVVVGSNGMGQAQSQSSPYDCEDCPNKNHFDATNRPSLYPDSRNFEKPTNFQPDIYPQEKPNATPLGRPDNRYPIDGGTRTFPPSFMTTDDQNIHDNYPLKPSGTYTTNDGTHTTFPEGSNVNFPDNRFGHTYPSPSSNIHHGIPGYPQKRPNIPHKASRYPDRPAPDVSYPGATNQQRPSSGQIHPGIESTLPDGRTTSQEKINPYYPQEKVHPEEQNIHSYLNKPTAGSSYPGGTNLQRTTSQLHPGAESALPDGKTTSRVAIHPYDPQGKVQAEGKNIYSHPNKPIVDSSYHGRTNPQIPTGQIPPGIGSTFPDGKTTSQGAIHPYYPHPQGSGRVQPEGRNTHLQQPGEYYPSTDSPKNSSGKFGGNFRGDYGTSTGHSGKFSGEFSGVFDINGKRIHQQQDPNKMTPDENIHQRPSGLNQNYFTNERGRFPEDGYYQPYPGTQNPSNIPNFQQGNGNRQTPPRQGPGQDQTFSGNGNRQTSIGQPRPGTGDQSQIFTGRERFPSGGLDSRQPGYFPGKPTDQDSGNQYETSIDNQNKEPGVTGIDEDSQAQASVQQFSNETQASAQAQGNYEGKTTQSQVSGTHSGSGSFSASAGSNDGYRGTLTQITGGKQGATSSAQGYGGRGKSQAQMQLFSNSGQITSSAQSGGAYYNTQSQVQGGEEGGMANAQSNGPGQTSSQAQIGFSPYNKNERNIEVQRNNYFLGGGSANAQGGRNFGQAQTQIHGQFHYGIKYTGGAQASSGTSRGRNFAPLTHENIIDQNNSTLLQQPAEEDYENGKIIGQTRNGETQQIVLPNSKNFDARIIQANPEDYKDEEKVLRDGETFESGQLVPGTSGYRIPSGFRGRIKSMASPTQTYAFGKNSQAQTVVLTPGTGKVIYESNQNQPYSFKSGDYNSNSSPRNGLISDCKIAKDSCVFGKSQRVCLPKIIRNQDGSLMVC